MEQNVTGVFHCQWLDRFLGQLWANSTDFLASTISEILIESDILEAKDLDWTSINLQACSLTIWNARFAAHLFKVTPLTK
jgi:hypothetical protein